MNLEQFQELAGAGYNRIPVVREVLADTETPLSTYLKLGKGLHSYFFESVQGGEKWGRFSIIGLPCRTVIRVIDNNITVETDGNIVEQVTTEDPFAFIKEFQNRFKVADVTGSQRFVGGLVGYFAYDAVRFVETSIPAISVACAKPVIALTDLGSMSRACANRALASDHSPLSPCREPIAMSTSAACADSGKSEH